MAREFTMSEWTDPEWFDLRDGSYLEAYSASDNNFLTECEVTRDLDGKWFFMVKATSNLSEYPEVRSAGGCSDREDGERKCEAAVRRVYETWDGRKKGY